MPIEGWNRSNDLGFYNLLWIRCFKMCLKQTCLLVWPYSQHQAQVNIYKNWVFYTSAAFVYTPSTGTWCTGSVLGATIYVFKWTRYENWWRSCSDLSVFFCWRYRPSQARNMAVTPLAGDVRHQVHQPFMAGLAFIQARRAQHHIQVNSMMAICCAWCDAFFE